MRRWEDWKMRRWEDEKVGKKQEWVRGRCGRWNWECGIKWGFGLGVIAILLDLIF